MSGVTKTNTHIRFDRGEAPGGRYRTRKQRSVRPAGEDDAAGRPCTRLAAARAPPLLPSLRCHQVRNPGFAFQPRSPQRESQAVPSCHPWHMRRGPTGFPRRPPASSASNGTAVKWPRLLCQPLEGQHTHTPGQSESQPALRACQDARASATGRGSLARWGFLRSVLPQHSAGSEGPHPCQRAQVSVYPTRRQALGPGKRE